MRAKNILVNKVNKTVWSTCRWRRRIQPQPASVFTFFHLKNVPGGLYWRLSPCIFSAFEGLVLSGLPHSVALPLHCDLKLRNIFRNCTYLCFSLLILRSEMLLSQRRYHLTAICPRDTCSSHLDLTCFFLKT